MGTATKSTKKYTSEYLDQLADDLDAWIKRPDSLWLGTFAEEHRFSRQRLPEFAAKSPRFAEVYEVAKQHQENVLFKMGLSKKFTPAMVIFALKNVAGWRDSLDVTTDGKEIRAVSVEIIEARKN